MDYVPWSGPNSELRTAKPTLAKGASQILIGEKKSLARGPNSELCRGAAGLAKGSIYSKISGNQDRFYYKGIESGI